MGADAVGPWPHRAPIGSLYVPAPPRKRVAEPELAVIVLPPPPPRLPFRRSSKAGRVVRLVRQLGGLDAQTLQDVLELTRGAAHQMLSRLAASGHLVREEVGRYVAAKAEPQEDA